MGPYGIERANPAARLEPPASPTRESCAMTDQDRVTPPEVYFNRRSIIRGGAVVAGMAATGWLYRQLNGVDAVMTDTPPLENVIKPDSPGYRATGETLTPRTSILNYNNFYEFTTNKDGVAKAAAGFKTTGWKVEVGGLVSCQRKTAHRYGSSCRGSTVSKASSRSSRSRWYRCSRRRRGAKYAPSEYGFFANVNPEHAHPRWSQATEQRIGESGRRKTLPVQRLRGSGRAPLFGDGPSCPLLRSSMVPI